MKPGTMPNVSSMSFSVSLYPSIPIAVLCSSFLRISAWRLSLLWLCYFPLDPTVESLSLSYRIAQFVCEQYVALQKIRSRCACRSVV